MCNRCGMSWDVTKKRNKEKVICASCRSRRATTVQKNKLKCLPWHGRFLDDLVTPVDDFGEPMLPGARICGYSDCCNPSHIE
jgi:hypothetical protein